MRFSTFKSFKKNVAAIIEKYTPPIKEKLANFKQNFKPNLKNDHTYLNKTLDELILNIRNASLNEIFENKQGLNFSPNGIILKNKKLQPLQLSLNKMIRIFPEFKTIIGRQQHATHKYTLDGHILIALQYCVKDDNFPKLSQAGKRILTISTFLHDISKPEGVVDKIHPINSANQAYIILSRINMPEIDKKRIYNTIKNHHWVEEMSSGKVTPNGIVKVFPEDIVNDLINAEDFEILKILARADLKAVGNPKLYENCKDAWVNQAIRINDIIKNLQLNQYIFS